MSDNPSTIVACCGLVCSNCGALRKGKCQGCHGDKPMFRNCPVKACVKSHDYGTCANCGEFKDLHDCGKLDNFISRLFGWLFGSNRIGNLCRIREVGLEAFKAERITSKEK